MAVFSDAAQGHLFCFYDIIFVSISALIDCAIISKIHDIKLNLILPIPKNILPESSFKQFILKKILTKHWSQIAHKDFAKLCTNNSYLKLSPHRV